MPYKRMKCDKEVNLLKELMEHFVNDIKKGRPLPEAGWSKKTTEFEEQLLNVSDYLERKGEYIRIVPNEKMFKFLSKSCKYDERDKILWLAELCSELFRMNEALDVLAQTMKRIEIYPELEGDVVVIGLWEMLRNNITNNVALDRILREGLNTVEWCREVPQASLELAFSIARKWWQNVELEGVKKLLSELRLDTSPVNDLINNEKIEKVRRILDWQEVLTELRKEEARSLGLLWFANKLLVSRGVSLPDAIILFKEKVWRMISTKEIEKEAEIVERLSRITEKLSEKSRYSNVITINWLNIIRLPW